MNTIIGTSNKILEIDLTTNSYEIVNIGEEDRKLYLGAKGLGLKLLYERLSPHIDPLSPENIIIFMPGVMMGTGAPCSNRFHAISKSPLTGIITTSSCGGPFGFHLKTAGWDGLIIKGKANELSLIEIDENGPRFQPVPSLSQKTTSLVQNELDLKDGGELVIGPAGENLVPIANIRSGDRYLGRGGLGAVLGSKNIKVILARGNKFKIIPRREKKFKALKKKGLKYINRNEVTSYLYRNFGTRANVIPNNMAGILPINNFQLGRDQRSYLVSGEEFRDMHLAKPHTCKSCAILCGQKGTFSNKLLPIPEYETIALLGTNLGIFDRHKIAKFNELAGDLGLDTISLGGILAWYMEAGEKNIINSNIRFGSSENIEEVILDIANANKMGKDLGLGVKYLSKKYGGEEFAIHVKGLEVAGYDPRGSFGQGLNYAVANRGGCHLSAFLVALEVYFNLLNPFTHRAKAEYVRFFESLTATINSLQVCQFTMFAYVLESPISKYTPDVSLKMTMQNLPKLAIPLIDFGLYRDLWSSVTGIDISKKEFLKAGDRIHVLERYLNCREGIDSTQDTLPKRFLEEPLKSTDKQKSIPLKKMLKQYYKLRGYDENGKPREDTLKKLNII